MRKLDQKDYIDKCNEVHDNKYDYSLVEYKNTRSKVKIVCNLHGIFEQNSKNHKKGQGCPSCSGNNIIDLSNFIKISRENNGFKYDYSLINFDYIISNSNIRIIDNSNGIIYSQLSDNHRNGLSPKKIESESLIRSLNIIHKNKYTYIIDEKVIGQTSKIKIIDNITKDIFLYRVDRHLKGMCPNKVTISLFKVKSSEIHNNKYDYSLIDEIKGNKDRVKIICPEHGIFTQVVNNHMNLKDGCPICIGKGKWNSELLKSEFKKIHLNKYDYSLVNFNGISSKVKIVCNIHGYFEQDIHHHLKGQGCKLCTSNSKGEEYVKLHLEEMGIKYIRQHGFDTCRYINKLNFDFYLPEYNTCIEFDGIQHFKQVKDFGGEKGFNDGLKRDQCKNKWCLENNVKLIRIKYNEIDKISKILNKLLLVI